MSGSGSSEISDEEEKNFEEKFAKYAEKAYASQGFDVDPIYDHDIVDEIGPISNAAEDNDVKVMVDFAIGQHNKSKGSNLQLVKIVKANFQIVSGGMYYITLDAKDEDDIVNTYEAKVFDGIGIQKRSLELFRLSSKNE